VLATAPLILAPHASKSCTNTTLSHLYDYTIPAGSIFGNTTGVPFRIQNESFLVTAGVGL